MVGMERRTGYERLTPALALQLAAPHTWVASVYPVLVACCVGCKLHGGISASTAFVLLVISVLMQSSVNAINDYFDFIKGADSDADDVEADDAVLVYHDVDPKAVRNLAIAFLVCAFLLGIHIILIAGWIPLAIALIGAACTLAYSGGATPISYLPIGEVVSGFVMGGLIAFASYYALTLSLDWLVFAYAIPVIIGIALVMLSNNISDIEKDAAARRRTLCVLLGRPRAAILYRILIIIWLLSIALIVFAWFPTGLVVLPFGALIALPVLVRLSQATFMPDQRVFLMAQVCNLNIILGAFYCMAIVF